MGTGWKCNVSLEEIFMSEKNEVEALIDVFKVDFKNANIVKLDIASKALVEIGEPAVEPLIIALNDEKIIARCRAAKALGEIGDPRAVDPLISNLNVENDNVRHTAVVALGMIGDPRAVEPLITILNERLNTERDSAGVSLSQIGVSAVEPLIGVLKEHEEFNTRKVAILALERIGDPRAIEPLLNALKDEHWVVRESAERALKSFGVSK
jgi:HEAT repeat protein